MAQTTSASATPVGGDLAWLPGWRLAELIRSGELSPVELVTQVLRRIEQVEPEVHSFITVAADQAMRDARSAERAVARGDALGPLHGVPISLKDNLWTPGIRTTYGSLLFADFVPTQDSTVSERLRSAGAIIVGKSNIPEIPGGGSGLRSVNRLVPECRNPWDARRTCGASSGGAAAGLAAGLVPLAVGTDDGGSIRLPSALCGVFGLFPVPGRVPAFGSVVAGPISSIGPMTRDVRDAALLLQALAGPDERDPECVKDPPLDHLGGLDAGVEGMRLAWSADFGHIAMPEPAVVDTIRAAAMAFAGMGAHVDEPDVRLVDVWQIQPVTPAVPNAVPRLRDLPQIIEAGRDPQKRALLCPYVDVDRILAPPPVAESAESVEAGRRFAAQLDDLFSRYDLLLSPTINQVAALIPDDWGYPAYGPSPAPGLEGRATITRAYVAYTRLVNVAHCAAASIPCGFVDGMPVGLQVIGRDEATVLRASRAFEQARPWAQNRPPRFATA
ncbi:MAG TPA: amidase [Candidatus Dormibacteraeota bacterium]|nr:amidase [Candidatus Dormibacteraeota bacterium]